MKWSVLWKTDGEDDLAEIWVSSPDKAEVSAAANRIDIQLRYDPLNTGESRGDDDRVYVDPPLAILFTIDEMDRKVFVERAWRL
jgi:hypothetical protein